jgi:hypothetical protein
VEFLLQRGKEVTSRSYGPRASEHLQLLTQGDHATATDCSGSAFEAVGDPSYSDRVPLMEGGTELGKVDRNAGQEPLDEFANQHCPFSVHGDESPS